MGRTAMTPPIHSSAPVVHSVHFYDHDEALIARLSNIITSAIETGNAVVIVATAEHRQRLNNVVAKRNGDLQDLKLDGRVNFVDADEALAEFMIEGMPDRKRFFGTIGKLIDKAKQAAWNGHRGLTVFGEMVAVLWEQGNYSGALALERLWNELLNDRSFHLHCAYPKALFSDGKSNGLVAEICESHSHIIGQPAA